MQKLLIFDWGRTLYDPDAGEVFPGVPDILRQLHERYAMAVVALATDGDIERRLRAIERSGARDLFSKILIAEDGKDALYEQLLSDLGYAPEDVVVIDDRTVRGISWGNRRGAGTIWVCRGKFSNELPTEETGTPTHTISDINDLLSIL